MSLFRRRVSDPAHVPFHSACAHVASAQRALLEAVPTSRRPGKSLAEALAAFSRHLTLARHDLDAWQSGYRDGCLAALEAASSEAERLRLHTGTLGFELLNARIGDVLHPLETFVDTEREVRRR